MKRKYFLLAALCAAMNVASGFAQDTSGKIQLYWPAATSSLWVDDQADHSMKTEYGFDGDETTRWSAGWEKTDNDANYPQGRYWYRACFGDKSVDFNVIRVKWYDNSVKTFQILTSDDYDNDFKVVYTSPAGREHTGWQIYNVGKQHGKAFRIQATEFNTDNDPRFSFYEIEAYNIDANSFVINKTADNNGFNTVIGHITKDNVAELQAESNANITAYDLTGVQIDSDVNEVKFANPNAVAIVDNDPRENVQANSEKYKRIQNAISHNTWYFSYNKLNFVDGCPIFTAQSIDTQHGETKGYTYTRTVKAGTWVTTYLNSGATLAEGLKAYEIDQDKSNGTNIVLKKADNINATTPYIIGNTTDNDLNLTMESAGGDFNLTGNVNVIEPAGKGFKFHGNYKPFKAQGNEFAFGPGCYDSTSETLTLKKVKAGTTIGTYRAYFTFDDQTLNTVTMSLPTEETGVKEINNADANKPADIYSIDGRLVRKNATSLNGLERGLYIVNGKKYVVK